MQLHFVLDKLMQVFFFFYKKQIFNDEALHQKCQYLQVVYSVCIQIWNKKPTKDLDSCTVDRAHLECKVQQMNILAWKKSLKSLFLRTSKLVKLEILLCKQSDIVVTEIHVYCKLGCLKDIGGYRRGACSKSFLIIKVFSRTTLL